MSGDSRHRCLGGVLLLCLTASCATEEPIRTGRWRAWLETPGGELPFGLELKDHARELQAYLINGQERIRVTRVERDGNRVRLGIEPYDSWITADLTNHGERLDGTWEKTSGAANKTRLAFHALADDAPRFGGAPATTDEIARIEGRWSIDFASDDQPAVGIFRTRSDGVVLGTFLTTTGDYRYLEGRISEGRLTLSCFDGAHAFLFVARLGEDGTLEGEFWSRDSWHDTWSGWRDPEATLPDGFELTRWVGRQDLGELVYPDLDGRKRSLADPLFAGRARILEVFGSWCPNCNDATAFLVELDRRYRERGLSIVGLAFEMTGDPERDAEQVRRYAEHHGVEFPLLLAGVSDKAEATKSFPLLDQIRSYPTTIFLHGDGRVRAVHQGYTGPATGQAHADLRGRFESLVEELLAESDAAR